MGLLWFVMMVLVYAEFHLLIAIVEHGGGPWGFCVGFAVCGYAAWKVSVFLCNIWNRHLESRLKDDKATITRKEKQDTLNAVAGILASVCVYVMLYSSLIGGILLLLVFGLSWCVKVAITQPDLFWTMYFWRRRKK